MEVEKWEKLGLSNDRLVKSENIDEAGDLGKRVEEEGFVAGARAAKRRKNRYKKDENGEEGVG